VNNNILIEDENNSRSKNRNIISNPYSPRDTIRSKSFLNNVNISNQVRRKTVTIKKQNITKTYKN
jgi:hypothetical protein